MIVAWLAFLQSCRSLSVTEMQQWNQLREAALLIRRFDELLHGSQIEHRPQSVAAVCNSALGLIMTRDAVGKGVADMGFPTEARG